MEDIEKKWSDLIVLLQDDFDEDLNLKSILVLIGVFYCGNCHQLLICRWWGVGNCLPRGGTIGLSSGCSGAGRRPLSSN